MKIQFDDPLFEAWTQRFIFTMSEGGCEIGEIKATAARIPEGDRDAWYSEWTATADRLFAEAEVCDARKARVSARSLYLRAATYYRLSYPLLYGRPTDPRVKAGYACEANAFARAAAQFEPPIVAVAIPFETVTLDTLPAIAPHGNDPVVAAFVDKFILGNKDTGLEKMLKDKGITSVITVGTAAHGAVLYTASAAALRGFNVIVPVDGMSGDGQNTFIEQYVAYNLTSAPIVSPKITLTRIDMIKF